MTESELAFASAAELAPLLKARKVSPVELVEAHLHRIGELNESLRAYIHISADQALAAAQAAEREFAAGIWRGPLQGIPVAYKDIIDVAGLPTSAASKVLAGNTAIEDATVVARLRQAGAICLGKLNLLEFASGSMEVFGATKNPWNLNYSAGGGSSTGSAVAAAAGLATCTLGTDTGGSIRGPAAGCGIPGLKPTYGRVSRAGVVPLSWSLDHVGPMARSVDDLALVLQCIAGPDPRDASAADRAIPDYLSATKRPVAHLRVGVPRAFFFEGCDEEVTSALEVALEDLRQLGCSVSIVELPHSFLGPSASWSIAYSEAFAYHRKSFLERSNDYTGAFLWKITAAGLLSAEERLTAQRVQQLVTEEFVTVLRRVDVLVLPATRRAPVSSAGRSADGGGPRGEDMNSVTRPVSLTGLPTLVLPCGFSRAGLPLAFQVVGRSWEEETLFSLGAAWEASHDWRSLRPQFVATEEQSSAAALSAGSAEGPASKLALDPDWVFQLARHSSLAYVERSDAERLAAMLTPVKAQLEASRSRLDDRQEAPVRGAPD
jgi:aspartyl-tRNA(Asn)/glutamyl-tRNA(Gln) amidotransferase subunit A